MKTTLSTSGAPGAIGPYSQGIKAGGFIFTSGQLPMTPDGALEAKDIRRAVMLAMANVEAILISGGGDLSHIVKTTIYLTNLNDFAAVNEAYASCFSTSPPARSCVQVAALPKAAPLEIEAVAFVE